jgi:HEAT repeat protein
MEKCPNSSGEHFAHPCGVCSAYTTMTLLIEWSTRFPFYSSLLIALSLPTALWAQVPSDLVGRLDSPEPAVRLDALRKIAVDYHSEALPFLIRAVTDKDALVRERAVQGLGLSGSPQAVALARNALVDPDESVRWRAVQALGRLGARDTVNDLVPLVDDQNWHVRVTTLELLGTISQEQLIAKSNGRPGEIGAAGVKPLLMHGLEDRDERVKLAAAAGLAKGRNSVAYGPLLELLETGSLFIRDGAALALGDLGDPKAIKPMIDALAKPRNHRSEEGLDWACWGIVKALLALTGQDFGLDVDQWNRWYQANQSK